MPCTQLIPSTLPGLNSQQQIRPLPPLPIHTENDVLASSTHSPSTERSRVLPPLPTNHDDKFSASVPPTEPTRPLTPPPMYSSVSLSRFTQRARALPPLPVCKGDNSSTLSIGSGLTQTFPPLPTSGATTPLSISSACTARALPLPPSPSMPVRPLPPLPDGGSELNSSGCFTNAQNFVLNYPNFTETFNHIQYTNEKAVFDILTPYTTLDATKDSNARYPPPQCHPETRVRIRNNLTTWLYDEKPKWKMFWISGFAGAGKSAIAQTFATSCDECKKLGATYFFSKSAERNKPETVIPTLAYQLAISVPEYKSLISTELTNDPLLLQSSLPVQFKRLIVQPFTALQHERHHDAIVIILDGLDQCDGQKARLILEIISKSLQTVPALPLRWVIFSRPEPYLKHKFIRIKECGREELVTDTECRDDVERFVRERVIEIQATYDDVAPRGWPSSDELCQLLDKFSGRFDVASGYLDDIAVSLEMVACSAPCARADGTPFGGVSFGAAQICPY